MPLICHLIYLFGLYNKYRICVDKDLVIMSASEGEGKPFRQMRAFLNGRTVVYDIVDDAVISLIWVTDMFKPLDGRELDLRNFYFEVLNRLGVERRETSDSLLLLHELRETAFFLTDPLRYAKLRGIPTKIPRPL
jgi:hypothetical protein